MQMLGGGITLAPTKGSANAPLTKKTGKPAKTSEPRRSVLRPLRLAFIGRPAVLSDIPKGLPASLGRRLAPNSKSRGFATWRAAMPTPGAKVHLQFKTSSNNMAAVDLQAMEEVLIPSSLEKFWSLKSAPELVDPRQGIVRYASR